MEDTSVAADVPSTEDLSVLQAQVREFLQATNDENEYDYDDDQNDDELLDDSFNADHGGVSDEDDGQLTNNNNNSSNNNNNHEVDTPTAAGASSSSFESVAPGQKTLKRNRRKFAMPANGSDSALDHHSNYHPVSPSSTLTTTTSGNNHHPTFSPIGSSSVGNLSPSPNKTATPTSYPASPSISPNQSLSPASYNSKPTVSFSSLLYSPNSRNDEAPPTLGKFQLLHHIGNGYFGNTFSAASPDSSEYVVVKLIDLNRVTVTNQNIMRQEFEILKSLSNQSVVNYQTMIVDHNHLGIVQEFVENGSLSDIYKRLGAFPESLLVNPPFGKYSAMEALVHIIDDRVPVHIPDDASPELQSFLHLCFIRNAASRSSSEQLLKHPWLGFTGVQDAVAFSALLNQPPMKFQQNTRESAGKPRSENFSIDFLSQMESNEHDISQLNPVPHQSSADWAAMQPRHYSSIDKTLPPAKQIEQLHQMIDYNLEQTRQLKEISFDNLLNPTLAAPVTYQIGSKLWKKGQEKKALGTLKDNFIFFFKNDKSKEPLDVVYLNDKKSISVSSSQDSTKKKTFYICIGTLITSGEHDAESGNANGGSGSNGNGSGSGSGNAANSINSSSKDLISSMPTLLWCLLGFDNQKDMEAWLGVLEASVSWYERKPNEISKPILEKKHTKQKSVDRAKEESMSSTWKKESGGMKFPGVFGIKLDDVMARENPNAEIPSFVTKMVNFLERHIQEEGILRISGSSTEIQEMKAILDKGSNVEYPASRDTHAVAGLLKLYLRELPDLLVPTSLRIVSAEIIADRTMSEDEKISSVVELFKQIPKNEHNLLKHMIRFAKRVTEQSDHNKMVLANVTTCFAQSLKGLIPGLFTFCVQHYEQIFVSAPPTSPIKSSFNRLASNSPMNEFDYKNNNVHYLK
ncbi:putative protein serine/threonine kinase [Heterostelium album PN500]|uniref:Uncharacterized protein n=1 Tax=Heterostelium pallidum (strain ATCC 26659 / Pp 5 / PN500) TaxID=670386 RepID=D3B3C7_HETP5|nr:putative protein serine/threonine kinase [Heterostelium album PN500]EFA83825.1 putative protein serine/threonine kinase [Heterostelium album PN500]|eukprot:XP_020435942.1 putative protein serine/threonine kinase [Heterostelium album PN500]